MPNSFDYAVVRVVPSVEREEFFNAGVILFCPQQKFLAARIYLDQKKLEALAPALSAGEVQERLNGICKICAGDATGGPIAQLSQRARFHWLIAPRSTWLQVSPAHSGICEEPEPLLTRLFERHVLGTAEVDERKG